MSDEERKWLPQLIAAAKALVETAKIAERNNKSLTGSNFYATQFHERQIAFAGAEQTFLRTVESLDESRIDEAVKLLTPLKSEARLGIKREQACRQLEVFVHTFLIPAMDANTGPPASKGEPVLLKAVVIPAKKQYLTNIVIQANVCYEARCYDAAAVMIRKLVEGLIIELYEAKQKDAEIKHPSGDFFMLADLVQAVLSAPHWNLARETKTALPKVKALGDRSAHGRRYLATQADVNAVTGGLRVLTDDLLHLAGLK